MKKTIFILVCVFLINLTNCFSQLVANNKNEFKSKTSVVFGYSNDFNELYLGITFGKVINKVDTTYNIKFHLYAPTSEFQNDIQIKRTSAITFLSKSGEKIDLKLTDVIFFTEKDDEKQMVGHGPISIVKTQYSAILVLNVTKDMFIKIGSEPFYNLMLPYYNSLSKGESRAIFVRPTLFIPRSFTQKSIKNILDI